MEFNLENSFIIRFIISLTCTICLCDRRATGRCGRPVLPPKSNFYLKSSERLRFDNNEEVIIQCLKDEFIVDKHKIQCSNGRWIGETPRCGTNLEAQVTKVDIFKCDSLNKTRLLSEKFNQSKSLITLPDNAFHRLQLDTNIKISAFGSKCYSYSLTFDIKVQFWFLLIELWVNRNTSRPELVLNNSQYRTCMIKRETAQVNSIGQDKHSIFGYYFICDLNSDSDYVKEKEDLTNTISFNIRTNFTGEIGLEAVFIGKVFTDSKGIRPECGDIQVKNLGLDISDNFGTYSVYCNDSFVDLNEEHEGKIAENGNPKHSFKCNWNGLWTGSWPVCYPKLTCPKDTMSDKPDSVVIEEIGNVYYLNESQWFAIRHSYIRYKCLNENDLMVGKNIRSCLKDGKWSGEVPYCTTTRMSAFVITGILFTFFIIFVSIVCFVLRMHSKRVERKLKETRIKIQESNRKSFSEDFYSDTEVNNYYEYVSDGRNTMNYETISELSELPRIPNQSYPEYLDILAPNS